MSSPFTEAPPVVDVEQIFHQHGAYVVRALRYFGVPERELPDVCQEVFVVVHRKLAEFEQRSSIRTWLYRIAQRAASDYRRRAHVRRELVTGEPIDGIQSDERHFDAALDARATLIRALGVLDEDKRAVFVLFEIEGLTMKEIAATLRCPLQTAYSRLHAARKLMLDVVTGEQKGVA